MFRRSAHQEGSVMQGYFLTEDERERQRRFPEDISSRDVLDYFTLSEADRRRVHRQRGAHNRWALPCSSARCAISALRPTI